MGKLAGALCATALALGAGTPAHAQLKSTTVMPVSFVQKEGCQIVATPMIFIILPPFTNVKADATATITLICTPNLPYTIDINRGLHAQGINRRMRNPVNGAYFGYDVYRDPPRSHVWGVGKLQNVPGNSGPTGLFVHTVYGRTETANKLAAGGYRDTLTITVNF
ncbi:Csu type fimbrial protein [Tsuneonella sp. HG222]